ncbi:MAG: PPOX class F420-dependent oxidoreductase [Thermoproteota archaeon]|jgi:PPOX class probable F420-dependent enzyme|nr:PPOX class F420-dependent oxidoreductase [Thermoproteota archaeon]
MSEINKKIIGPVSKIIEKNSFAFLATLMEDGSPHVSPVWIDIVDNIILINTAKGRIKQRNVSRDPRVSISLIDDENPYSMVTIRGKVIEQTSIGADEHIDKLAKKYLNTEKYPGHSPNLERVILRIKPEKIFYLPPRYEQYLKKKE